QGAGHPDRGHLGRHRRDRPHQLPRRGQGREAGHHQGAAEAEAVRRKRKALTSHCCARAQQWEVRGGASALRWCRRKTHAHARIMADFLQLLIAGLATGAIYALAAIGFTLLWQTSQTINFAQGEFVMLPAFFALVAMHWWGLPFGLAALIAIAAAVV